MTDGSRTPVQGPLGPGLTALKAWREEVAAALAQLRRWALVNELTDEHAAARLAHLERRLVADHLAIAFVAEVSRGKSALINALFFADLGGRLLPSGCGRQTLCATEIRHDPAQPPSIRLLPIETRESPRALREFITDAEPWKHIALDPAQPEALAAAFDVLAQTRTVSAAQAHDLGLPAEAGAEVEVPCWRYAIVNFPHPLLSLGLTILDTPGLAPLATEPELTLHRLPEADAVVFMLAADAGATAADLALWRDHVVTIEDQGQKRYVALNRIDVVRDGASSASAALVEIDRRVRESARALGVDRARIYPLSAQQGLAARIAGDGQALVASGLPALERALVEGLLGARRTDHAAAVGAESRSLLAETRSLLRSRRSFVEERVAELAALHGKNQKLVESLGRKFADERTRLEETRGTLAGFRAAHGRHADALAAELDPEGVREAGVRARAAVLASPFSAGINEAVDGYFSAIRGRLTRAIATIGEARATMAALNRRLAGPLGLAPVEVAAFPTDRFLLEIDRLEEHCRRDFHSASSLLTRGRQALAALFFDTVALKVVYVFEIADRDARAWMSAFLRPLESQVAGLEDRARTRIAGVTKIRDAETDLAHHQEDLQRYLRECAQREREWAAHAQRLARLLDIAAAPSLTARR